METGSGPSIPFGFAGGLHDRDTGLVRFGYCDYDPDVCRWIAKDPFLFAGEDTNLSVYVGNHPVMAIDPIGLYEWEAATDGFIQGAKLVGWGKPALQAIQRAMRWGLALRMG